MQKLFLLAYYLIKFLVKANDMLLKYIQVKDINLRVRSRVYSSELTNVALWRYNDVRM